MENITKKWLQEKSACSEGVKWFLDKRIEDISGDLLVDMLMNEDKFQWANWLIVRIMDYKQRVQYAVFAAEQVLDIFEKKYPNDKRPREAIEAAKKCIDNPSDENKKAAYAAYAAAYVAAAYAADDAADAAYVAADAAYAAAYVAYAVAAAYVAYVAARDALRKKIIAYGLTLLREA